MNEAYMETWYYIDDGSPKSATKGPKLYALKDAKAMVTKWAWGDEIKWKIIPVQLIFGEPIN